MLKLFVCVPLLACGAAPAPTVRCEARPLTVTGMEGQPLGATLSSNVFFVPVEIGATRKPMIVDTGAPVTLIDPAAFPGETLPMRRGQASLRLGALTLADATVISTSVGA